MNYLKRKIDAVLDDWHDDEDRLPIILKGARQVGKTETVRQFARRHYDSFVEINFVEEPNYKRIVDDGYAAQSIVSAISRIDSGKRFLPDKKTLIFFDEVQDFPDIATSLKFFAQDGRFDVICSGSLLGVHYKKITSNSVGFKMDLDMRSLDFKEFLWTRILNVFRHIPAQLAKENRKFQISKVAPGARFRDYRGCIEWLADAGVVNVCHCLKSLSLPLSGNYDDLRYKLYMADTGLLIGMLDKAAGEDVRVNRNFGIFKGGLYENIVAEALTKAGCELYYWRRDESPLEMDFFLRDSESLVPVEVKGGNDCAKSLKELVGSSRCPAISWGIKLADANIGFQNGILTMPWFCAFLLPRLLGGEDRPSPAWFEPER